jgi:hypothetical protein
MNAPAVPANLTLIGGEILAVADGADGLAGGPALEYLAAALAPPGARVLVAGPHDDQLVRALTNRGAQVTRLLRAYPDAEAVALAQPDVRVLAGSLSKLDVSQPYDAVIAVDGCHRLCSVEGTQLNWAECVDMLAAALAPNGVLLLSVANPLGLDRLVALPATGVKEPAGPDESAPAGVDEIARRIGAERSVTAIYAGYPTSRTPSLLLRTDALTPDGGAHPVLATLAAAAAAHGFAGQAVLTDPRTLAATAVRAGAAAALAPAWIVAVTPTGAGTGPLPPTVVADRPGDSGFGATYELVVDGASAIRRPVPGAPYRSGPLERDVRRLAGPVPRGRMLDELLLTTAARPDAPALRQALRGYVTWLATLADPIPAVPANVVVTGDAYALLDPSWRWTATVRPDTARARALRLVATELAGGGLRHPWPATAGVDDLTTLLAAAADSPVGPAAIAAGIALDVEVRSAMDALDPAGRAALGTALAELRPAAPRADLDGHRELRAALLRERREVSRLAALNAWCGRNIALLEDSLRRSERQVALFSGSIGYRSTQLAISTAKRTLRPVKRRVKNLMGR